MSIFIFSSFLPDSVRRGIFAFPFRCPSALFYSVSGPVVAIRCHSVAYLSTAVPLLHLPSRFDSLRCLSVAVLLYAYHINSFPLLCQSLRLSAIPLPLSATPVFSVAVRFCASLFRCCAFRRLSMRFRFGAVRFFSIRFRCGYSRHSIGRRLCFIVIFNPLPSQSKPSSVSS